MFLDQISTHSFLSCSALLAEAFLLTISLTSMGILGLRSGVTCRAVRRVMKLESQHHTICIGSIFEPRNAALTP